MIVWKDLKRSICMTQAFPDRDKEKRFQESLWSLNRPLYASFAIGNALHTVYIILLLFFGSSTVVTPYSYTVIFGVLTPLCILLLILTFHAPHRSRRMRVLWNVVLAAISVAMGTISSLRTVLCYYRLERAAGCPLANRPNAANSLYYAILGPLLALLVTRLNRVVASASFLILMILQVWATTATQQDSITSWFILLFSTGAFIFAFLVNYFMERNDRLLFQTNVTLLEEVVERKQAQAKALEAEQDRAKFTNYIFHEIRVPLNTVIQSENLLESDEAFLRKIGPEAMECISRIRSGLGSIETIINDSLDLRRLSEGKLTLSFKPFDFHDMINSTLWPMEPSWTEKQVKLRVDLDAKIDALTFKLISDPDRLRQVVWNYVSNAVKFTPPGGFILVTTKLERVTASEVWIRTEVIDTGIGISEEDQSKLFKEFVQIRPAETQEGKGSGLGLAICATIVKRLQGHFGVRSKVSEGSTFWFNIPLTISTELKVQPPDKGKQVITHAPPPTHLSESPKDVYHILVTDDDRTSREVMAKLLQKLGHTVVTAEDGIDCLEKMQKEKFDILFIDNQMPRLNGEDTILRLKEIGDETTIISLSGTASPEGRDRLLTLGVSEILVKPSTMATIDRTLRSIQPNPRARPWKARDVEVPSLDIVVSNE